MLAAAEADARIGDYEGAIRWLSLVEELNLVIPPNYVARRHEWRQKLEPGAAPDAAAERIDPSFESAATAISDLQRRVGWLREIEHRTGGRDARAPLHAGRGNGPSDRSLSTRRTPSRADDPRTGGPRGLSTETGGSNMARLSGGSSTDRPEPCPAGRMVSGPAPL